MALQKAVAKNPDFEFLPSGKVTIHLSKFLQVLDSLQTDKP